MTATREKVSIAPETSTKVLRGDAASSKSSATERSKTLDVRLTNHNPFSVVVHGLTLAQRRGARLIAFGHSGPITLRANTTSRVTLRATGEKPRRARTSSAGLTGQPEPRFALTVPDDELFEALGLMERLDPLSLDSCVEPSAQPHWRCEAFAAMGAGEHDPPSTALSVTDASLERGRAIALSHHDADNMRAASQFTARLLNMEAMLRREHRLANANRYTLPALHRQSKLATHLSEQLSPLLCVHERDAILSALDTRRHDALRAYANLASIPALQRCFEAPAQARLTQAAIDADEIPLAVFIAKPYKRGVETPEPFKTALIIEARRFAERWWQNHRGQEDDTYGLSKSLDGLTQLRALEPSHETLALLAPVASALADDAGRLARERHFSRAQVALAQLERAKALAAGMHFDPSMEDIAQMARSQVAYYEGRFTFHYRRSHGDDEDILDEAEAHFSEAQLYAPVTARAYLTGIALMRRQLFILALCLVFALVGIALVNSPLWRRARMWHRLRWTQLMARTSVRFEGQAWDLLTRLAVLRERGPRYDTTIGQIAGRLMEMASDKQEHALMREAVSQLQQLSADAIPQPWRTAEEALEHLGVTDHLIEAWGQAGAPLATSDLVTVVAMMEESYQSDLARRVAKIALASARFQEQAQRHARRDALKGPYEALCAELKALIELSSVDQAGQRSVIQNALRTHLGMLTAAVGPSLEASPAQAWAQTWAMLRTLADDLPGVTEAGLGDGLLMSAAAAAPLTDAVALFQQMSAPHARREGFSDEAFGAALWTAAQRARLPVPDPEDDVQTYIARKRAALMALAQLDNLLTDHLSQDKALAPRLTLAILRRLGSQLGHRAGLDAEYDDDMRSLFEQARRRASSSVTQDDADKRRVALLAATLDLLTPGDWGFDAMVDDAVGEDLVHFQLLEALDHYAAGRRLEAAAGLACADPTHARPAQAARLLCARATVAASIGQTSAALAALRRAVSLSVPQAESIVIDRTAARLLNAALADRALSDDDALATIVARGAMAALADQSLPQPTISWGSMAAWLAQRGHLEAAGLAAGHSARHEGDDRSARMRQATWRALSQAALSAGRYDEARHWIIMSHDGNTKTTQSPVMS